MKTPIVVIPSCTKTIGGLPFNVVGHRYASAVAEISKCQPLCAPLGSALTDVSTVLDIADGILLSGSLSNVEPRHYSEEPTLAPEWIDRDRDALTLPLIKAAIERKVPLFAICRGFQELNVALGGSLHQQVHIVDTMHDHREPVDEDMDVKFGDAHPVNLQGALRDWVGADEIVVNSLHVQGIRTLAPTLVAEAFAKDGLVEGVRAPQGHAFSLGVQWHPEWRAKENPVSVKLFERFGQAVRGEMS